MLVATFNAASVRARLPILTDWLERIRPDVLAIQETKVENDKFPYDPFYDLGYDVAVNGQKSWNGVALLTNGPAESVRIGFEDDLFQEDARIIECSYRGTRILNTYVPNGTKVGSDKWFYKMRWLERFRTLLEERGKPSEPLIWMGDVNVARQPIDVYDSKRVYGGVGHHPDEFSRLDKILDWGLTDVFRKLHPEETSFTYWEFVIPNAVKRNIGWRIDHIYATAGLAEKCTKCWVDVEPRGMERPSDHTFVLAEFDI